MKVCVSGLIFMVFIPGILYGSVAKQAYLKGVQAYEKKDWGEAERLFQESLQSQPRNVLTLYNLGLVAYQQQNQGEALAFWRRALSLRPRFAEAQEAITFTLKQMPQADLKQEGLGEKYLKKIVHGLPITQLLFLCAFFIICSGSFLLKYWGHRKRAFSMEVSTLPFPVVGGVLSILCLFFISLVVVKGMGQLQERATIVVPQVQLRLSPTSDSLVIGEVWEGTEVVIQKKSENWTQIVTPSGLVGWMSPLELWSL